MVPTMKASLLLLLVLTAAVPAMADEVYIYGGRAKDEYFDFNQSAPKVRGLYVVLDLSAFRYALVVVDSKAKSAETITGNLTSWIDYPYNPQKDARTRTFIYADEEASTDMINFHRFRSTSGPALLPVSNTVSKLLARTLTFSSSRRLSTVLVREMAGSVSYLKDLTKQSNDAGKDLTGATQVVTDYLKARHLIN